MQLQGGISLLVPKTWALTLISSGLVICESTRGGTRVKSAVSVLGNTVTL